MVLRLRAVSSRREDHYRNGESLLKRSCGNFKPHFIPTIHSSRFARPKAILFHSCITAEPFLRILTGAHEFYQDSRRREKRLRTSSIPSTVLPYVAIPPPDRAWQRCCNASRELGGTVVSSSYRHRKVLRMPSAAPPGINASPRLAEDHESHGRTDADRQRADQPVRIRCPDVLLQGEQPGETGCNRR